MSQLCRCKISLHLAISSIPVKSYWKKNAQKGHDLVKKILIILLKPRLICVVHVTHSHGEQILYWYFACLFSLHLFTQGTQACANDGTWREIYCSSSAWLPKYYNGKILRIKRKRNNKSLPPSTMIIEWYARPTAQVSVPVMSNSVSVKSFSFPYKGLLLELHIS